MKLLFIVLALFSLNLFAKPVDINSANAETISKSLAGIGQKKAEAIVRYRIKNGAFKTLDDFAKVKGIGEKTIKNNLKDILFSKSDSNKKSKGGGKSKQGKKSKNI